MKNAHWFIFKIDGLKTKDQTDMTEDGTPRAKKWVRLFH